MIFKTYNMSVLQFFFTYSFPFLSFFPLFLIPILFGSKEINTYIPNIYQLSLKGATFPSFELVSFLEPTQNISDYRNILYWFQKRNKLKTRKGCSFETTDKTSCFTISFFFCLFLF